LNVNEVSGTISIVEMFETDDLTWKNALTIWC
jgi:hypothetical protein